MSSDGSLLSLLSLVLLCSPTLPRWTRQRLRRAGAGTDPTLLPGRVPIASDSLVDI